MNRKGNAEGHSGAGYKRSPTYNAWRCMKERCLYEKHRWFKRYGGRGITVCDRWLGKDGFANFLADMKERPSIAHTVDRENSDGNYEPTNCRWATKKEQFDNIERPFGKERTNEQGSDDPNRDGAGGGRGPGADVRGEGDHPIPY